MAVFNKIFVLYEMARLDYNDFKILYWDTLLIFFEVFLVLFIKTARVEKIFLLNYLIIFYSVMHITFSIVNRGYVILNNEEVLTLSTEIIEYVLIV